MTPSFSQNVSSVSSSFSSFLVSSLLLLPFMQIWSDSDRTKEQSVLIILLLLLVSWIIQWIGLILYITQIQLKTTLSINRAAHIAHSGRHAIATWLLVLVSALAWPVVVSSGLLLSGPCLHDTPSYTPRHARCDASAEPQPYATALLPLLGAWNLVGVPKLERQERPDECTGQVKVKRTFES